MQSTFHFKKAGLYTSIQDRGRIGQQHNGIPIGGAMDQASAKIANWLVNNKAKAPVLEITLAGPSIQIEGTCQIALTGANLSPTLNGQPVPLYQTINIIGSAQLDFGTPITGCRSYLAIRGQWQIQPWLNSYSAASIHPQQLTPDSLIQTNSQLKVIAKDFIDERIFPKNEIPIYNNKISVRVLAGPEFGQFDDSFLQDFFSKSHPISNQSNRMGYRLEHDFANYKAPYELISSATLPGCIQISNAGQAIILMRDAQTTGGYFRIANIHSKDLDKVAQLKPGDEIRFLLEDFVL